jgi:prepilin-type N-terminal cleavage/methylation domain-containing protein
MQSENKNSNIMAVLGERSKKELWLRGRGARFFSQSLRFWEKSAGFTLIELLITIAITTAVAVLGIMNLVGHRQERDLILTSQEIATVIRNAQDRSIAQEEGSRWGVYFGNPLSGGDFYELFKGTSYATGAIVSKSALRSNIQFDIPASNSSSTVIFSPITGLPNTSTTVKISLVGVPTSSSTIIINTNGEIRY